MKCFVIIFSTCIIALASCTNKGNDGGSTRPINCIGLITDTAGTNSTARVYLASAVSANNDGKNEIIKPILTNISTIDFTLYNLNNQVVFNTTQLGQGYNPPILPINNFITYYYKIQATTNTNKKIGICGEVYSINCIPATIDSAKIFFEDQLRANGFTGVRSENLAICQ